jgi:hypothetical protein
MKTCGLWHTVYFHNASVKKNKTETPYRSFTGEESPWVIDDFKVFGCPTYVLEKALQDGNTVGRWKSRSWCVDSIFPFTQHSNDIPIIHSPEMMHVSPPFHVNLMRLSTWPMEI